MVSLRDLRVILAAAVVVSAVLFYFGTGFEPVAALAWVAPLPVLLIAPRVRARAAALSGFLAFFAGTANSWDYYLGSDDVPMPFGAVICVGLAVVFALTVLGFRALVVRGRLLPAAGTAPAIWAAALFLIALSNPAGIMGTMAWSQANVPVVLQLASVTGVWGVEYLALFVPAAVAAIVVGGPRAARLRTAGVLAGVVLVTIGGGALRLAVVEQGPPTTVATVVRDDPQWGADLAADEGRAALRSYAKRFAELPGDVDQVVLPEGAFAADRSRLAGQLGPIRAVAAEEDIDIVVGVIVRDGHAKYNSAVDVAPDGELTRYDKWHDNGPVTLGHELVPTPGDRAVGLMVCMDVNHPDPSAAYADSGTRLALIPAADEEQNGQQHARTALIRGVEHGFSVAWAAQRGVLMTSDGLGHVVEQKRSGTAQSPDPGGYTVSVAEVRHGPGGTAYTALGDWFGWVCVVVAVLAVPLSRVRARSGRPAEVRGGRTG